MLTITDYVQDALRKIAKISCQFEKGKIDFISKSDNKVYQITIKEIEKYEWE